MLSLKSMEHVRLKKEKVSTQEGCKGVSQVFTRARTGRREISSQNKRFEADHMSEFRGHNKEKKAWILVSLSSMRMGWLGADASIRD